MRAFWELSSCRAFGMSIGPIPWTAVVEYAERKGLDSTMILVFEVVMRELDEAYLTDLRENQRQREAKVNRNREKARG